MFKSLEIKSPDTKDTERICRSITETLLEWFGIPEANEMYAKGVKECTTFAAYADNAPVGMIALKMSFSENGNIYWMGVKKNYHHQGVGKALLHRAEQYCREKGCYSLTVETLSPKEEDPNYLNTYRFYQQAGFRPLFELSPYDSNFQMVYLQKLISLSAFKFVDLTHSLNEQIPTWEGGCGFKHEVITQYEDCTTECKFLVQQLNMVAGIGTHIDAPAHCILGGLTIDKMPLESLVNSCVVIDLSNKTHANYRVDIGDIQDFERTNGQIHKNTFVIIYTGWEKFWKNPSQYRSNHVFPALSLSAAEYLLSLDIAGIGTDTLSPDLPEDGYPVHSRFLKAGKTIVENIANANQMPPTGGFILMMPIKIEGGTEAPMRLVGLSRR